MKRALQVLVLAAALAGVMIIASYCVWRKEAPPVLQSAAIVPVPPHGAASIDPEELGIFKFVFETVTPPGKVMVLRTTRFVEGRRAETRESIAVNTYRPVREVLLVYNSLLFNFNPDPDAPTLVVVKFGGQQQRLPPGVNCTVVQASNEPLALVFSNGERWTYDAFLEDYASVKVRLPDLMALPTNGGWTSGPKLVRDPASPGAAPAAPK